MEVAQSKKGIVVTQHKYTLDLLNEIGILGSKPVYTLMDINCKVGMKEVNLAIEIGGIKGSLETHLLISHSAIYCFSN